LLYARLYGSAWQIQTVDAAGNAGLNTSLVLDESNVPHISYCDGDNYDVKYAYLDASGWSVEAVDGGYGATSLALDASGFPHMCYVASGYLTYAYHDGSGWQYQTVSQYFGGDYNSLVLTGSGNPRIGYYGYSSGGAGATYACRDASGWHVETVDTDGGWHTSIAGTGIPHITYAGTYANLKYAYHFNSFWYIEDVNPWGDGGSYTSLALDGSWNPHISYYGGALKYAYRDYGPWQLQTVDSSADAGKYTSLALDGSGYAHISYYDEASKDLKYAYKDATGWHLETVDAPGSVGRHTSLALDDQGLPHISYYDETNGDLKFARRDPVAADRRPDGSARPLSIAVCNVAPVPAQKNATIWYELADVSVTDPSQITVRLYDCVGRLVAPPMTQTTWQGNNVLHSYFDLPSGTYLIRLSAGSSRSDALARLVVVR
jgi:hypothetical protein